MTRLTHREAAEAVLAGKALLSGGYGAGGDSIRLSPHYIDQPSCYTLAAPTPQPTEAPMPFDPTQNRIQTMHLTADERRVLDDAKWGWEFFANGRWTDSGDDQKHGGFIYRAKPAPAPTPDANSWADDIAEMVRNNCAAMLDIIAKAKAGKLQRRAGVRRWRLELVRVGQGYAAGHKEDAEGYWVSYDDHVRAMAMVGLIAEGVL